MKENASLGLVSCYSRVTTPNGNNPRPIGRGVTIALLRSNHFWRLQAEEY